MGRHIRFLAIVFLFTFGTSSAWLFDDVKDGVVGFFGRKPTENSKKLVTHDDAPEYKRNATQCSFALLEAAKVPPPNLDECDKLNNEYSKNENYDFVNNFGTVLTPLKEGMDSIALPKHKMKTVFFAGNTGSGKTTLVQILGTDNTKLYSKEVGEDSGQFIIEDDEKIGTDTVVSRTLYPELIEDPSGYVLVDNPGFQDTRSSIHEVIATYAMRKVLGNTEEMRIVIVCNYGSLQKGINRYDFTNLLKHLSNMFKKIEKYESSIYLIATKVENKYIKKGKNSPLILVSDETVINGIGSFLMDVKESLLNNNVNFTLDSREEYTRVSTQIIDYILKKDENGKYDRINIVRQPEEAGPLSNNTIFISIRNNIRNMLLTGKNDVGVDENDFGYAISDTAKMFLTELFHKMNSYMTKLSGLINKFLLHQVNAAVEANADITATEKMLLRVKKEMGKLSEDIGKCKNPGQYLKRIGEFSDVNKLKLNCLTGLENVQELNAYLAGLEELEEARYTSSTWNTSIATNFIEREIMRYRFLGETYERLSSYKSQKYKKPEHFSLLKSDKDFGKFLEDFSLASYSDLEINDGFLLKLNTVLSVMLQRKIEFSCMNGTLIFIDYFLKLSDLDRKVLDSCAADKIVILGLHTIFIDVDLTLYGKEVTVIAPVWEVVGSKRISVEGISGGKALPKAGPGEIGEFGKNGESGGKFSGIGMVFNNGVNLKISAKGGRGQDGQEGGDGKDGEDGNNADLVKENEIPDCRTPQYTYAIIVNYKSTNCNYQGEQFRSSGSDSGGGGLGGFGGRGGMVNLHNIGQEDHGVTLETGNGEDGRKGENGKAGKGGRVGCDLDETKHETYFLFFKVKESKDARFINCGRRGYDGDVINAVDQRSKVTPNDTNQDSPICPFVQKFRDYYADHYTALLSDGISKTFINDMIKAVY